MRIDITIVTLVLFGTLGILPASGAGHDTRLAGVFDYVAEVGSRVESSNRPIFLPLTSTELSANSRGRFDASGGVRDPQSGIRGVLHGPQLSVTESGTGASVSIRTPLDFGSIVVDGSGGERITKTLILQNNGEQDLIIHNIETVGNVSGISFGNVQSNSKVRPGESVSLTITFDPVSAGQIQAGLRILSNDVVGETLVKFKGAAFSSGPQIQIEAANSNLGGLALGATAKRVDQLATIRNIGAQPLSIYDVRVAEGADQFTVDGLPRAITRLNPLIVQSNETQKIGVLFDATKLGIQRGVIQIYTNDPKTPIQTLTIIGTGLPDGIAPHEAGKLGQDFVAVQAHVGSGSVQRTVSDADGKWAFTVSPNTLYKVVIFDPEGGLVASQLVDSDAQGRLMSDSFAAGFQASTAPDKNQNGMPDDIDFAMGTAAPRPASSSSPASGSSSVPRPSSAR